MCVCMGGGGGGRRGGGEVGKRMQPCDLQWCHMKPQYNGDRDSRFSLFYVFGISKIVFYR